MPDDNPSPAEPTFPCNKCKRSLPVACFNKSPSRASGLRTQCRECEAAYAKAWLKKNHARITAQNKRKQRDPEFRKRKNAAARRLWARTLDASRAKQRKKYTKRIHAARAYFRAYVKKRLATDLNYKIRHYLRSRLRAAMKYGHRKIGSATRDLGCTTAELRVYLERLFIPGMSWENYGPAWHIDHKTPLSAFDLTKTEEFARAVHYSNLQPMWARKNISKGGASRMKQQADAA